MNLLQALLGTVLPIFVLAGLGFLARRGLKITVRDPARLAMYLLTPGLIAHSILHAQLVAAEVGKIVSFALMLTGAMLLITLTVGSALGWSSPQRSAAVLSTTFMNAGNYGLPLVMLALGPAGFERAAVFVVMESFLMYSLGVYFAARGRMDWRRAVASVLKMPMIWAALSALAVRLLGIPLPDFILKPVEMLANGALVVFVILLGMQVASIELKGAWSKIGVATLLRLVVSPLVAMALVAWLRLEPLTARVMVLESAMPSAVNTTLLAVEFGAEPDQVSGVTLVSTLLSLATLTFWVWYLQP